MLKGRVSPPGEQRRRMRLVRLSTSAEGSCAMLQAGALPVIVADRGKEGSCERAASMLGCARVAMPGDLAQNGDLDDIKAKGGLEAVTLVLRNAQAALTSGRDEERRRRQQDENARLQDADRDTSPPTMTVEDMLADCVWIATGS